MFRAIKLNQQYNRVKLNLQNAVIILIAGMLLVLAGVVLKTEMPPFSNPVVLSGLAVEFIGTIWLVLSLNQRRKKEEK
jgi:xanthine/uracil permease